MGEIVYLKSKMKAEEDLFSKIIVAIQNIGEIGATIDEISNVVPLERHTLSKYLNHLRADGRVSYKQVGRGKVWFVSKAPLQYIFRLKEDDKTYTEKIFSHILSDMPEGVLILDFDYNILFMNLYLTTLYGDCVGQKYYWVFFGLSRDPSGLARIIDGNVEEVGSCVEDEEGRMLDIRARREENPDGTFSIIAIIREVTEKVLYERQIRNLSELHRLLGESVNRSYTIDQLCFTMLRNLQEVLYFDMGTILIYDALEDSLLDYAQIGYLRDRETREVEEWKRRIALEVINRKVTFLFDIADKGADEDDLAQIASRLAVAKNLQEVYAIPLKTKGEIHGALLILTKLGRPLARGDRHLLAGLSETIAGGIAKIKAEEEWRLRANAIDLLTQPIFMSTVKGNLTSVNPAFLKMWGYDREEEVLGRHYSAFWKDDVDDVATMVRETGSWRGELMALRKDDSEFKARLVASLIIGKKGPLQFVAVVEPLNGNLKLNYSPF